MTSLTPAGEALLGRPFIHIDRLQNQLGCAIVWRAQGAIYAESRHAMTALALGSLRLGASWGIAGAADPPCDKYPVARQATCAAIWKALNQEDGPSIAQFGLDQLKRREEGKINAEQHLGENMAFIKQSTEKRLERLRVRMEKE